MVGPGGRGLRFVLAARQHPKEEGVADFLSGADPEIQSGMPASSLRPTGRWMEELTPGGVNPRGYERGGRGGGAAVDLRIKFTSGSPNCGGSVPIVLGSTCVVEKSVEYHMTVPQDHPIVFLEVYDQLSLTTNNFVEERQKLGKGGFGKVYRGFLRESHCDINAVKRISKGSKQGKKEHTLKVNIISQLRHRNLVQFIGWCHEKKELLRTPI
ncbi:putative L-type lectin-domain containing receptor kinase I.1 [Rhododendron vialii]|uniref:putative L-type lectin-domain containing receptor kinase I.1 n=1 Tax=Rhododendron vialii TaxID=182163 RepID=UPI00265DAC73|nr:putative L-type lectin-domain containing receptor kinase I.1 [Rhododendron vialii]